MILHAEQFLIKVLSSKKDESCKSFDELRVRIYHRSTDKKFIDLPCTSNALHENIRRSYYIMQVKLWLDAPFLNAAEDMDPQEPEDILLVILQPGCRTILSRRTFSDKNSNKNSNKKSPTKIPTKTSRTLSIKRQKRSAGFLLVYSSSNVLNCFLKHFSSANVLNSDGSFLTEKLALDVVKAFLPQSGV